MSTPSLDENTAEWLYNQVEDYCESTGEPQDAAHFFEAIKSAKKRKEMGEMWDIFYESATENMPAFCGCGAEMGELEEEWGICGECK